MNRRLGLFEATGIEMEYMIVDARTLAVRPLADEVLRAVGGGYEMEVELGPIAWSNELALHVIELKTNGPVAALAGVAGPFQEHVQRVNRILETHGARLMPTAMHPWMDPERDLELWPHENNVIYDTLHRIFDCRGHGWANLQSVHINLPFADDAEFTRLHDAIRLVLPILPALAASSPYADGRSTGWLDTRMEVYRHNADAIPSVVGKVVPERATGREDYESRILGRIYRDLAGLDPEGILKHEWINARGAIARFDRYAIEIRVLDIQESPRADVAIVGAVRSVVRALAEGRLPGWADPGEDRLAAIFVDAAREAEGAVIDAPAYLQGFGMTGSGSVRAGEVWHHLVETVVSAEPEWTEWKEPLELILDRGTLARRIQRAVGEEPDRDRLATVYRELCDGLEAGALFPGP